MVIEEYLNSLFFLVYLWLINADKSFNLGYSGIAIGCSECFQDPQIYMYFSMQFSLSVEVPVVVCKNCY